MFMRVVNLVNLQRTILPGVPGERTFFVAFVSFCKVFRHFSEPFRTFPDLSRPFQTKNVFRHAFSPGEIQVNPSESK
jgi:hypothetical protein